MTFLWIIFLVCVPILIYRTVEVIHAMLLEQPTIDIEIEIIPEYNYDDIVRDAMFRAANGDAAARNWVMKHVYNDSTPASPKSAKVKLLTPNSVVEDAISALVALKMKKAEAKAKVESLAMAQAYTSVGPLLNDVFRR